MAIDRTVVGWRAWYTGGRVYDSTTTAWEDLPADGALAFRVYHRTPGRSQVISGDSFYWLGRKQISGGETAPENVAATRVKRGSWTEPSDMDRVNKELREATEPPR